MKYLIIINLMKVLVKFVEHHFCDKRSQIFCHTFRSRVIGDHFRYLLMVFLVGQHDGFCDAAGNIAVRRVFHSNQSVERIVFDVEVVAVHSVEEGPGGAAFGVVDLLGGHVQYRWIIGQLSKKRMLGIAENFWTIIDLH